MHRFAGKKGPRPMALFLVLLFVAAAPLIASQQLSSQDLLALSKVEPERAFSLWAAAHARRYLEGSLEYKHRLKVFIDNVNDIIDHNGRNPGVTLALNEFADLTWDEFSSKRLGLRISQEDLDRRSSLSSSLRKSLRYAAAEIPKSMDWREKGAVTEVKNQGQCGSCWAFSTTGAIEGINAIVTGQLQSVSEQQLVDCDTASNMGCGGGLMDDAFKYVVANGGLDTEEDYGYWSGYGFGFWCNKRKQADRPAVSIDGYEDVPQDEASLQKALAHQPVAVAICAGASMQFYSHGVISNCCEGLNHGVLAVGYNVSSEDGSNYWIVKNSWGAGWGEKGYFRLKMGVGAKGLCEIASAASYPIKKSSNKLVPEMCDMFGWTECPVGNSCSCSFDLFGLICLWHDCCPLAGGVTCPDLKHCCPSGTTCDQRQGVCISEDGAASVPWIDKSKTTVASKSREEDVLASTKSELLPRSRAESRGEGLANGRASKGEGQLKQILPF